MFVANIHRFDSVALQTSADIESIIRQIDYGSGRGTQQETITEQTPRRDAVPRSRFVTHRPRTHTPHMFYVTPDITL